MSWNEKGEKFVGTIGVLLMVGFLADGNTVWLTSGTSILSIGSLWLLIRRTAKRRKP